MQKINKILIILFLVLGVLTLYMGLSVDLKCSEATFRDNLVAGLPLWVFGIYCLFTSLFLWKKPLIGKVLAVITFVIATVLFLASVFDLSIPIIKTSCTNL
ncbi:MAG: hypothetical protein AAB446_01325 [Patescibacteria group bacterium]